MLKILQARLQQYVNHELADVQALLRQRNQRSNCQHSLDHRESKGIPEKICFIDYMKVCDCVDHKKLWKILKRDKNARLPYLLPEKPVYRSRSNS